MTKSQLSEEVAGRLKVSVSEAETMATSLVSGERIEIPGLEVFEVREDEDSDGRDPVT